MCVNEVSKDISGNAISPLVKGKMAFCGVHELFLKMDTVFDRVGYPQAFQEKRSFSEEKEQRGSYQGIPEPVENIENICRENGKILFFDIMVCSRRNASWQGGVFDKQGQMIAEFQGELELLEILQRSIPDNL